MRLAPLVHGHGLGQTTIDADAVRPLDPSVGGIAARQEENSLAVRKPGNDLIVNAHAVAERLSGSLEER